MIPKSSSGRVYHLMAKEAVAVFEAVEQEHNRLERTGQDCLV